MDEKIILESVNEKIVKNDVKAKEKSVKQQATKSQKGIWFAS